MPRAGDAFLPGQLPRSNDPLQRIDFQAPLLEITLDDILEQAMRYVEDVLFPAINELTGIDLGPFLPVLKSAVDLLEALFALNPLSGDFDPATALTTFVNLMVELGTTLPAALFQALFGFFGGAGNETEAENFFTNLLALLGAPGLTAAPGSFDPIAAAEDLINDVLNPTGLLASITAIVESLTGISGGDLSDIARGLLHSILPPIPISSITKVNPNLLSDPTFAAASTVNASGWTHDLTEHHSATGGSAKTTANGTDRDQPLSGVRVFAGQQLPVSVWAQWSSLTVAAPDAAFPYTLPVFLDGGFPIQLVIDTLFEGVVTGQTMLVGVQSPGSTSDWQQLVGTYTVPASGVDEIRLRPHVDAIATGGSVWFSDGSVIRNVADDVVPINWVDGLVGSLQGLDDFVQVVIDTFFEVIGGVPVIGGFIEELFDEINSWFTDTQVTAGQASDAFGGVQDVIDAFVKGFQKFSPPAGGWAFPNLDTVFDTGFAKSKEISEIAAGLAALRVDQTAQVVSGRSYVVTVSQHAGIPAGFTKFVDEGAGVINNDGDTLEFTNDTGRELFVYNTELATDYFETSLVVPRQAGDYFGSYGNRRVWFIGRANHPTAPTRYCMGYVGGNKCRVGCVVDGVTTWFGGEQTISPGSYMTFRGGVGVDARDFQLLVNNQVRGVFDDAGNVSFLGDAYRYTGFGIQNEANDIFNRVPNVSHMAANDNTPPPFIGVGCKVYRANTASGGGGTTASTGYPVRMDSTDYCSDHFTVISEDPCVIQSNITGTLIISGRIQSNATFKSSLAVADPKQLVPCIECVDRFRGQPASSGQDGSGTPVGVRAMSHTWLLYVTAGQQFEFVYDVDTTTQGWGQIGDSAGTLTYLTVTAGAGFVGP